MATHQLAKGLASLGRHGDSMLMHVSPSEVAGLKAVGEMTGHKLHINPNTGMPEAFDFGDFFSSLLPTLAGFMVGGPAGGAMGLKAGSTAATIAPIAAGVATGAAVAGAKGDDPLMGALMGGLGGYGGGNLAKTFGVMGGATPATANLPITSSNVMQPTGITDISQGVKLGKFKDVIPTDQLSTAYGNTGDLAANLPTTSLTAGMPVTTGAGAAGGLDSSLAGVKKLISDPFGTGYEAFQQAGGSALDLAAPIGMAALAGAQEDLYPQPDTSMEEKRRAEENKYRDPRTGLLNLAQASPGLRLMATGGTVGTNQSTISSGGIQDLYGTNDQTTGTQSLSRDGYGIGRLNTLAAEGSRAKAADTFYAAGGPIAFATGGSSGTKIPQYGDSLANELGSKMGNSGFFGGLIRAIMLQNPEMFTRLNIAGSNSGSTTPTTIDPLNAPGMYPQASNDYMASKETDKGTFALEAAKGGYLDGQGDGMSDSIPATIEGKQPARLADGEFVVPADVVSHLGNGSSKAGSKKLYSMLDRVRKARTGHTKQGKEINPNKYMPA